MTSVVEVDLPTKTLIIKVDKLTKNKELRALGGQTISLNNRRVFHKTIDIFAKELSDALVAVPSILEPYLQLNKMIISGEFSLEERIVLVDMIDEHICANQELLHYVLNFVEENYTVDIEYPVKKDTQNALQITNIHAKRIIASSIMARITMPLVCSYMKFHNLKKENTCFMELMDRILKWLNFDDNGEVIDLGIKIQKYVAVQVDNTLYSDQVIWKYLKNLSIDNHSVAIEIHRNLLTNIIPKLEVNRSVVSYFHAVIQRQLEYQFTSNFKLTYKPISSIRVDSESINPFVTMEQRLLKNTSELSYILLKLDVENYIRANSCISASDLEYHLNKIVIHSAQTQILEFFISKQIGRGIPVLALSKKEYVEMLFIAKKWFEENGYNFVSFILLGIPIPKHTVRRNFNKGKHLLEIIHSTVYKDIEKQYNKIGAKVNETVIIAFLGSILNTDFDFYIMPDGKPFNTSTEPSLKTVMVELLTFISTL